MAGLLAHLTPSANTPRWVLAVALLAVVLALLAALIRAAARAGVERTLVYTAAAIATGVSGTGMWQVAERALHLDGPLRVVLFGFAEIALICSAVRARRYHQRHGVTGADGAAVWVIAAGAGAVSAMESTSGPEVAVRLAAPLLAAWLWHRGLDDGAAPERAPLTARVSLRRLLVALRLADPVGVELAEVARLARLDRVVAAALRVDAAGAGWWAAVPRWRLRRAGRAARRHLDESGIAYVRGRLAAMYGLDVGTSRAAVGDLDPWATQRTPTVPRAPSEHHPSAHPAPVASTEQRAPSRTRPKASTTRAPHRRAPDADMATIVTHFGERIPSTRAIAELLDCSSSTGTKYQRQLLAQRGEKPINGATIGAGKER
jgi:hypothetical protein